MKKILLSIGVVAVMASTSTVASATVYLSKLAFDAANPGASTTNFSGLTGSLTPLGSPFVHGAVTITGPSLYAVSTGFWGSVDSILDNTFNGFLNVSFAPTSAVGFNVAGSYGNSPIKISFFNGATQLFTDTPLVGGVNTAFSFYGVNGLGAITSFRLDSAGISSGFANVGPVSLGAVPEPASWALMIAGFGLSGAALRRRQKVRVSYA